MPDLLLPCPACDTGHTQREWHSLGMVCARCSQHTGNNHQGHWWRLCKVTGTMREFHMCCPGDCEMEVPNAQ